MRKTKSKTFSLRSRTTSLILALLLTVSAASVGLAAIASAVAVDEDSGDLAETGAPGTIPIESMSANDTGKAFWVDASYYDYLSDEEHGGTWLNPIQAGTGYDSADDWYTFESFNKRISAYAKENGMQYPLYFGNFCNTVSKKTGNDGDYMDSAYQFTIKTEGNERNTYIEKSHGGPYARVIKDLYNYDYFIDNSNALTDRHDAVIGLAENSLDSSGNIVSKGSVAMPYFNAGWLEDQNIGKTFVSSFPFRQTTEGNVTTYSFDSEDAKDNVFFNWSGSTPTSVGYGQGIKDNGDKTNQSTYGVKDGLYNFMGNQQSGYGIFPFNRPSGNGGNNNLDYGFGIKMNMDFRVPENGKIGNKDVKFTYSGDDDLWVYITPYDDNGNLDYANSYLALDLGGNHKQAQGEINFASMRSTITTEAAFASSDVTYKSDTIYIAASGGWNDINVWAFDGGPDHWVNGTKTDLTENGRPVYAFKLSDFNGCTRFTTCENRDWTGKRAKNEGKNLNSVIHSQLGNVCWSENPNWIEPKYPDNGVNTGKAGINYATATQKTKVLNGGQTLDPDKTYHMTIFYMERGMIESNCSIGFTMTPVKNDFKVNKTVNVENINDGLKSIFTQDKAFSFTTSENGTVRTDTKYILNSNWNDVSSRGVYQLNHNQTADFVNQHQTGSILQVNESVPNDGLTYTTQWNVVNNKTGSVIKLENGSDARGNSLSTDAFKLIDPSNASAPANLQANFVNTPKVAPLTVVKSAVDENNNPIQADEEFTFTIQLDVGQGMQAYNLAYNNGSAATGGKFKLTAKSGSNTAVFPDIPVGTKYQITEEPAKGYKPISYSVNGVSFEVAGGALLAQGTIGDPAQTADDPNASPNTVEIVNQPGKVTATLQLEKFLGTGSGNIQYKDGSNFTFSVQGLGSAEGVRNFVSAADMTKTVSNIGTNGRAVFKNEETPAHPEIKDNFLKFNRAGVYIFKLTESTAIGGDDVFKAAVSASTQQFLAVIRVTANTDGSLTAANPEYYTYDGGTVNVSCFTDSKKISTAVPQFINPVKPGKVIVNKKDGAGKALNGVEFTLYRMDGNNEVKVDSKTTSGGKVTFENLDVYDSVNGIYTGTPTLRTYVLKESKTVDGHFQEATVHTFQFGINDKFEYTFNYVNAALKHPDTGMFDVFNHMPLGVALIFLSFVAIGLYIAVLKKKQIATAHTPRFY